MTHDNSDSYKRRNIMWIVAFISVTLSRTFIFFKKITTILTITIYPKKLPLYTI